MALLNKADIPDTLKRVEVEVQEWGGSILIQELTLQGRDEYFAFISADGSKASSQASQAKLLELTIVNEKGHRLFDYAEIFSKSGSVITNLFLISSKISGLDMESLEEAKNKVKNLVIPT